MIKFIRKSVLAIDKVEIMLICQWNHEITLKKNLLLKKGSIRNTTYVVTIFQSPQL
ncbi:hypothetical protein E2C01_059004 [Portunus trituberculatus]|uniref:Uncharacterized protein n=1 Tax=Portunus trituberculatus TaxID=210409 RepID=A0A5B7H1D0_PORTR|nr:hypothetical protein [Portunus trituberculatus]